MSSPITVRNASHINITPPTLPPPLLTHDQVIELAQHGYVPATLSAKLFQLHKDLQAASRDFFAISRDVKQTLLPASQGTELGYYHVEYEKEYVTFRHAQQSQSPEESCAPIHDEEQLHRIKATQYIFETLAQQAWLHTASFLHRVLVDVSRYLGIDPTAWDPILDGCLDMPPSMSDATPSLLRSFLYEPQRGVAAPHKDNGLLTLCVGNEKGLEVWRDDPDGPEVYSGLRSDATASGTSSVQVTSNPKGASSAPIRRGAWHDASGPTILVGTALFLLSDGRINAGSHRVVASPRGRSSTVFALRPSVRHTLDLTSFGGEGEVEMEALWKKIVKGRVNVNAKRDVREVQEREREARRKKGENDGGGHGAAG